MKSVCVCRRVAELAFSLLLLSAPVQAATLPPGFSETLVAAGILSGTAMQFSPDGRLFVCEQGGRLRVIKDGVLLPTPFLTVPVDSNGERGLLGVAFDPEFVTNQYVFVYYTATTPFAHNRISRFTADGDIAVAGSEMIIFELDPLNNATNHNGGALAFGPDGKLYAAVGENANGTNAQSLNTVLGKMLRINKDGSIPVDNPFFSSTIGNNRAIWAFGLRNPFTFAFHPSAGTMFINDVGEGAWEEINDGRPGANYGWPEAEGFTANPQFQNPRYAYSHSDGCAITGGAFYAPATLQFPSEYLDTYFFADYCGGWIRRLDPAAGNSVVTFGTGIGEPVDLKVAADGSLYYLARASNAVYRIAYGTPAPSITEHPASQSGQPGTTVTFRVRASGPPPLRYQWQMNGADLPGATGQDYSRVVIESDNGHRFRAKVSNDFGEVLSNEALMTVTSNQGPTGTISLPIAGALYRGGAVIEYAGTATDPEDGSLPGTAFTWQVDFHHDTHTHPFIPATSGASSGSFVIPTTGETSANVWYRIHLTVRDSAGLSHSTHLDMLPEKVRLTLATAPAGLQLRLDGQPITASFSFESVVGITRGIGAPTSQAVSTTTYQFGSWSDAGASTHTISTPAADTTYTATYTAAGTSPAVALIQQIGTDAGTTTTATLPFHSPNTGGNFIAVAVRASGLNQTITIKDNNGNLYQRAIQFNVTRDGVSLAVFYAENIAGGHNAVTVSNSESGTLRFAILEYSGIATSDSLDVTAAAEGLDAAPHSGTAITIDGAVLIGVLMTANPASVTAGDGYTLRTPVPALPNAKLVVEDRVQVTSGSTAANAELQSADVWGIVLAAFRTGGPPPSDPPAAPALPNPASGAGDVGTAPTLSWTAAAATSYDIRFGTSSSPPVVATGVASPSYTPGTLASNTAYFWQVVARNSGGSTPGPVWSFTTVQPPPTAAISFVQSVGIDAATTTKATLAFPSDNTGGNFIAVVVRASGLDQAFTISDSNGNAYQRAVQFNVTLDGVSLAIFYAENVARGANAVTVSNSQTGTLRFVIMEYAGIAGTDSLDAIAAAQGTNGAPDSGTVTTGTDETLLIGAVMTANPASVTAGNGYTLRTSVPSLPDAKLVIEDRVQLTSGPVGATALLGGPDAWGVTLAAFRAATIAAPAPPAAPASPTPGNAASNVWTTPTLSWSSSGATSYDIRFGTASAPPFVATNLGAPSYTPSPLLGNTTYYWQVVAHNGSGTTVGPVWNFRTEVTAAPEIALVQQIGVDAGTTSSATLEFLASNTSGSLIVACIRASGLNQAFRVRDTNGNEYRQATQFNVTSDGVSLAIFYAENVRAGANAVTVENSQAGTLRFVLLEYSGVASANALDVTAAAEGMSTSPASSTVQTSVSGALMIGAIMTANPAHVSPGAGYTLRTSVPAIAGAKLVVEDQVQGTSGPAAATGSLAVTDTWGVAFAVFRPGPM